MLLVAITERRSRADIDRLAEVLGAAVAAERGSSGGRERIAGDPGSEREQHGRPVGV